MQPQRVRDMLTRESACVFVDESEADWIHRRSELVKGKKGRQEVRERGRRDTHHLRQ